jgi:hypothetical protein
MYTPSTAEEGVWGGFLVFGIASIFGLRLITRALQNDTNDSSGLAIASRGWFITGGVLFQLPLIAFLLFVWRQGFFH